MYKPTKEELGEVLRKHKLWLSGLEGGECAYLHEADLSNANLCNANLHDADLSDADLSNANLCNANLRYADLHDADLHDADLSDADLRNTVLSGAKGLLSSADYMKANFEKTTDGYIVYKCFNGSYKAPPKWKIESGEVIEEEADSNRANSCGCGINVAPLGWVKGHYGRRKIYKLLIKWEWLPGVVVPYNTDGKIRCERAMIIGVV